MNRFLKMGLFVLLTLAAFAMVTGNAGAASKDNRYLLSEEAYKSLSNAQELMGKGQNQAALSKLKALLPKVKGEKYDTAMTYQTMGFVYGEMSDYENATSAFRKALEKDALPEDVSHNLHYNLAQMLIHQKKYKEGIKYLDLWLKQEKEPSIDAYMLAAGAYYQSENFSKAIPYVQKIIARQKSPEEMWYQMLLSCYYETKQYKKAADLLQKLVRVHPENKNNWMQLVGMYQRLEEPQKALATLALAEAKGILNSEETLQLARMFIFMEQPWSAARLLESGMAEGKLESNREILELLATSWLLAHEKEQAAEALKKAADLSGSPKLYAKLGQIYFELESWNKAQRALEEALADQHLENRAAVQLILGITYYRLDIHDKALIALKPALDDKSTRDQAEWWIRKLEEESARSGSES